MWTYRHKWADRHTNMDTHRHTWTYEHRGTNGQRDMQGHGYTWTQPLRHTHTYSVTAMGKHTDTHTNYS